MIVTRQIILSFLLLSIPLIFSGEVSARAPKRHNYVGVESCKLCHKKKELGDQYDIWANTSHSKAFYALGTPEGREIADGLGIKDPQQSGKCLRCHATSYAFSEENVIEDLRIEDGVQCESCHGPGEDYMYMEIMEDIDMATAEGMVMPTEETCRKCHNPESPTYNPDRDPMPDGKRVDFYYPMRKQMIEHHKPLKEIKK